MTDDKPRDCILCGVPTPFRNAIRCLQCRSPRKDAIRVSAAIAKQGGVLALGSASVTAADAPTDGPTGFGIDPRERITRKDLQRRLAAYRSKFPALPVLPDQYV